MPKLVSEYFNELVTESVRTLTNARVNYDQHNN